MKQKTFSRFLLFMVVCHSLIGLMLFWQYLIVLPQMGWINSVGPHFLEGAVAVWFMLFSWPLIMIVVLFWNSDALVSKSFSFVGIVGALVGVSLMPASGFWFMLILCLFSWAKFRNE